jgi:hypothetical protein
MQPKRPCSCPHYIEDERAWFRVSLKKHFRFPVTSMYFDRPVRRSASSTVVWVMWGVIISHDSGTNLSEHLLMLVWVLFSGARGGVVVEARR